MLAADAIDANRGAELAAEAAIRRVDGDEVLAFGESGSVAVVRNHRKGPLLGSVVLLGAPDVAPESASRLAQLRHRLPMHGWHTVFAEVDSTTPAVFRTGFDDLLQRVRDRGQGGALVVIAEGGGGVDLGRHLLTRESQGEGGTIAGVVLLNLPPSVPDTADVPGLISEMKGPLLIVQESPRDWRNDYPLPAAAEIHRLPPGTPNREDDRVLRRIRGWLERTFS